MPECTVENLLSQFKKDFYTKLGFIHAEAQQVPDPTLSTLTEEELKVLESVWVELSVWQHNQSQ
ncbi:hypothetical protein QF117_12725 [Vibrio sp. YMD68]|uniref:hypothetical protein n=1 Tax=Vibrio sp. YMD68 TaxID=3042300 RepID=UPI00249C7657|nr:hypothetical protein [Vibrio sp. YMD68]WGW01641.1 hypothetical protein QF117_12725 [Vibrio sp. YMD68]